MLHVDLGRTIAQAVSRLLPNAATRVRAQVRSCGICGGQSGTGAGFLRVLRFPLPRSTDCHLSSGAGTVGQSMADVASRLSLNETTQKTACRHVYRNVQRSHSQRNFAAT
jgi:hypothetical protein